MDDAWTPVLLTLRVALVAAAVALPPALALAWLLARRDFRGKSLLSTAVLLPLVLPPVVTGYLLLLLFGRNGVLGPALEVLGVRVAFGYWGAVVAAAVVGFPLLVQASRVAFEGVDPRLEGVARTLGRGPLATFRDVTLRLAAPGVAAGVVLAFARGMGEFGATAVLAGSIAGETRTLALAIYGLLDVPGGESAAATLTGISIAISLLALLGYERLARAVRHPPPDARRPEASTPTEPEAGRVSLALGLRRGAFELDVAVGTDVDVLAFFGHSGAGKSTLLQAIAGLVAASGARIEIAGRRLDGHGPEDRRVGYVTQDPLLFPHLTVAENLAFGRPEPARLDLGTVAAALELEALLDRRPAALSGGEQQRVALGRAVLREPAVLLLDEPFAALDEPLRDRLLPLVRRARALLDVPLVLVSHRPHEVRALADEVVVLEGGRVAARGTPATVLAPGSRWIVGPGENLLEGEVVRLEGRFAVVRCGDAEILGAAPDATVGDRVRMTLTPRDIGLAQSGLAHASMRNQLHGTVSALRDADGAVLVDVDVGCSITALLTPGSVDALGLSPDASVVAIFKATSVRGT